MKNYLEKLLLAINFIFLISAIAFLTDAYRRDLGDSAVFDSKETIVREQIAIETNIEKLRSFSMVGLEAHKGATKMITSVLDSLRILVVLFCIVTSINIFFLIIQLRRRRDLTTPKS